MELPASALLEKMAELIPEVPISGLLNLLPPLVISWVLEAQGLQKISRNSEIPDVSSSKLPGHPIQPQQPSAKF